jgi:hypothetical protein
LVGCAVGIKAEGKPILMEGVIYTLSRISTVNRMFRMVVVAVFKASRSFGIQYSFLGNRSLCHRDPDRDL